MWLKFLVLKKIIPYILVIGLFGTFSCAKRGTISGGLKDTIAPLLKVSIPENYSTDFKGQSIKITFDEYVKLKDVNKSLIVSPPLAKKPQVLPLTASKTVTVNFLEPLQPNTTYSLNFGQSIQDHNEGNPYRQFKYVFSTGPQIDSLTIAGNIKDALEKKADADISVMLYEANEKYNDSLVYKNQPRYVTSIADTITSFKIDNIKEGKYHLIALKDRNGDYKFDPKTEKIGFYNRPIQLPNDSLYELKLFKEIPAFKVFRPYQNSANSAIMGYEGNPKNVKLSLKKGNETIEVIKTKIPKKDSLQIWFKPFKLEKNAVDSMQLSIQNGVYSKELTFKIKNQKTDTLLISFPKKILDLSEMLSIPVNLPIAKIDESKMKLLNKDSLAVPFKVIYDEMELQVKLDFKKEMLERYTLKIEPGAVTSYLEQVNNKQIVFSFETKNTSDYGNLRIDIENVKRYPIILELTDKNGQVAYSYYCEKETQIDFNFIKPELYTLRIIEDANKNGVWDSGNFLEKKQPENVIYFPKDIDVRANWDVQQSFILK